MSARLLIHAISDLNLPPMRASDDEINALRADPDLGDWYECADCVSSANAIAESLLVTYRNLKGSRHSAPISMPPAPQNREWWLRCEDGLNQYFAYWAITLFLAGMAAGAVI
jgi:hypothetical protein